jgi:predicted MFS family arabinose efflux permease
MDRRIWWLTAGNFAVGTSVLLVNGLLDEIARALHVSIEMAGQLTTVFAVTVAIAGPLLATLTAGIGRRQLLVIALLANALGGLLGVVSDGYFTLCIARVVAALGAAMFVPHAATTASLLVDSALRGKAVTIVFSGWVFATVIGVPLSNAIGVHFGWRASFAFSVVLPMLAAGVLHAALPRRLAAPPANGGAWLQLLRSPALMLMVTATALQLAGQLTLYVYLAPWLKVHLGIDTVGVGWIFMLYGAANGAGMLAVAGAIDRVGPGRLTNWALGGTFVSMLLLPFVQSSVTLTALVMVCWGFGSLAINAGMQARLIGSAPWLATASVPLNSSAISVGQACGAIVGAWVIAQDGYDRLAWAGALIVLAALMLSRLASRQRLPVPEPV